MPASRRSTRALLAALVTIFTAGSVGAGVTPWVPLEIREGQVLFPVTVAGRQARALFDTGSLVHSIDAGFAEEAGLQFPGERVELLGAFSREEVGSIPRLPVRLFGADLELRDVVAMRQPEIAMIVGVGLLNGFVLQLDYPNARMRLMTKDAVDLGKAANAPLRRVAGLPAVQVTFPDGKKRWLLFDTGNAGPILVRREVAEKEGWIQRYRRAAAQGVDVHADVADLEVLVLPSLTLGPFELEDVPVVVPAAGERTSLGRLRGSAPTGTRIKQGVSASGILGYEVLRHFVVTIDYQSSKLHLSTHAERREAERSATQQAPPENPPPGG